MPNKYDSGVVLSVLHPNGEVHNVTALTPTWENCTQH